MNNKTPGHTKLLADLFFSFAGISLFTVGGGPAMIPLVIDLASVRRNWLSKDDMMECLTVCQSLPGGVIMNMSAYIGRRLCGLPGMLWAVLGAILPTATLAILVGILLGALGENTYALGAIQGAKAAAAGLVFVSFVRLGKGAFQKPVLWVAAFAAMAVIVVLHVSVIWVIIAGGFVGWVVYQAVRRQQGAGGD